MVDTTLAWCDACHKKVRVERHENGPVVVHCPKCVGECALCECRLAEACFRSGEEVTAKRGDS